MTKETQAVTTTTPLSTTYHDEFVTAIEGGITYWSEVVQYDPDWPEWFATIIDIEGQSHRINEATIRLGLRRLADAGANTPSPFQRIRDAARSLLYSGGKDTEAWEDVQDADTADMVVQYALFGELVYG
jgi:hypothetical protein